MPFPIVMGVPEDTPVEVLLKLRRDIVTILTEVKVPAHYTHAFFPKDMLPPPTDEKEGANTIYVRLDTGMFQNDPNASAHAPEAAMLLAKLVWGAFDGAYEVKCFIGELRLDWKYLVPSAT